MAWSTEDIRALVNDNARLKKQNEVAHAHAENSIRERDTFEAQAKAWRLIIMDIIAGAFEMSDMDKEKFVVPPIEMMSGWREHAEIVKAVKAWWSHVVNGYKVDPNEECRWCGQRYSGVME